jgi:hypothetical protein
MFSPDQIRARIRSTETDLRIQKMGFQENEILEKDNTYRTKKIEETEKLLSYWNAQLVIADGLDDDGILTPAEERYLDQLETAG